MTLQIASNPRKLLVRFLADISAVGFTLNQSIALALLEGIAQPAMQRKEQQ